MSQFNVIVSQGRGSGGVNAYLYVAWASDDSGTGFTTTFNAALDYIAFKVSTTVIVTPAASDFTGRWKCYKGQAGAMMAWHGAYAADHAYVIGDGVVSSEGRGFIALGSTTGNAPPSYPTTSNEYWSLFAEKGIDGEGTGDFLADGSVAMTGALTMTQIATPSEPATSKTAIYAKSDGKVYKFANGEEETEIGSGAGFWSDMPGSPTRVSDTQFTITDTGNADLYDKAFAKGTIIKWLETTTFCTAMVESASYADNAVTINIGGDSLTAGFTKMMYCIHKAIRMRLPVVPGTLAVADNPSGVYEFMPWDAVKLSIDAFVGTAGTTNATTGHVNDDGTAINSADFSIASAATSDLGTVCDAPTTIIAAASKLSIDITAVSTTAPVDLYVYLWCYPESWRYLA